jgi:hypothetical protein
LTMDGVTGVSARFVKVFENVVMGVLEPAADTETITVVVAATAPCCWCCRCAGTCGFA